MSGKRQADQFLLLTSLDRYLWIGFFLTEENLSFINESLFLRSKVCFYPVFLVTEINCKRFEDSYTVRATILDSNILLTLYRNRRPP